MVGITPEEFSSKFPRLYHMASDGSWDSIKRHGLLSTTALLDLFQYEGLERKAIEGQWRPEPVMVQHPHHGSAVIRDQKPMNDSGLLRCLDGMTPEAWYRHLNLRVFFWLSEERLNRMLNAGAYRNNAHLVLILDSSRLLERHAEVVMLAPINTGATKPFPHPRGVDTFKRMNEYPFDDWAKRRHGVDPVVELAVDQGVPDVWDLTVRLERRRGAQTLEVLAAP
jgi:hypothetical protein